VLHVGCQKHDQISRQVGCQSHFAHVQTAQLLSQAAQMVSTVRADPLTGRSGAAVT